MNLWNFVDRHTIVLAIIRRSYEEHICFIGEGFLFEWVARLLGSLASKQGIMVTETDEGISYVTEHGSLTARTSIPPPEDRIAYYTLIELPPGYLNQVNLNNIIL